MSFSLLGGEGNVTNAELVHAWHALGADIELVSPPDALATLRAGDVALARIDVLPTLDGLEPGLLAVFLLERRGVGILNTAAALLGAQDKLRTARLLVAAGLPHPLTVLVRTSEQAEGLRLPVVLKPRFGSWGRDVFLCESVAALEAALAVIGERSWFKRHGALAQALIPPQGHDLRVIVARGVVVGAAERVAAVGEWRTNVSLGGSLRAADPDDDAAELARAAAAAIGADLVGVDLLPLRAGGYAVLELNGAVDFDSRYSIAGSDAYARSAEALGLISRRRPAEAGRRR